MALVVLIIVALVIGLLLVATLFDKLAKSAPPNRMEPRPQGGSMGRLHQQMDPKTAASTIYSNLKAQGGLQQGRVYSASYFRTMLPEPVYGFSDDWIWWQMMFNELNTMMLVGGYAFPASAYDYGGQPSIFLGNPADPMLAPTYYGDPTIDQGVPIDPDMGSTFMPDDAALAGGIDGSAGADLGAATGVDPDLNAGSDDGGIGDSGGGFDSGSFDSGDGFDSGGGFDGGGGSDGS